MSEDLLQRINIGLQQIRPYLQSDGGDIELVSVSEDLTVKVQLMGACGSCPMSIQTLKAGVEHTIRKTAPEIKEVVAVEVFK